MKLTWAGLFAHYVPVVVLAVVFGWLAGASSLISDDHMLVSVIAPTVAGMSVLAVVTLAILVSFVSSPAPLPRVWRRAASGWSSEPSAVAPDEPSHIHIPRRPKGDGA